jgi:murein DD-endopeptidase MepM/ murein hydrolase activator NlpD
MRGLALCAFATLALGGCAVSHSALPRPIASSSPGAVAAAPPQPNLYATAPRGSVHSELFACNGGAGANLGEIGARGEAARYTPYIHTPAGALLRNPTETACLSSGFGWRGGDGGGRPHNGLDLANPGGGFIYAAGDGHVRFAGRRGGLGLVLEIDHGHGVRTLYAHLSEIDPSLRPGDFVAVGIPVARMGATGNATGVHLHYEVSIDGLRVDPLAYGTEPPQPVL